MKTRILAVLALAAGLAACSKDKTAPTTKQLPKGYVPITIGVQASTRGTVDASGNFSWAPTDELGVYSASGLTTNSQFTLASSTGSAGTFSGGIYGEDLTNGADLYAVYPYDATNASTDLTVYKLSYATTQVNGDPTNAAAVERNMFMVAAPAPASSTISMSLTNLMSLWDFDLSGVDPTNPVTSVTVEAKNAGETPFFSNGTVDITSATPAVAPDATTKVAALTATVGSGVDQSTGTFTVRLALLPVDFSGASVDMTIVVEFANGMQYMLDRSGTNPVAGNFAAGVRNYTTIAIPATSGYVNVVSGYDPTPGGVQLLNYAWRIANFSLTQVTLLCEAQGVTSVTDAGVQLVAGATDYTAIPGWAYSWNNDFGTPGANEFTVTVTGLNPNTTYYFTAWATGGTRASSSAPAPESFGTPVSFAPQGFANAPAPAPTRSGAAFTGRIYNFRTPVDGGKHWLFNSGLAGYTYTFTSATVPAGTVIPAYSFTQMYVAPATTASLIYYELDPIVGDDGVTYYMLDRNLGAVKTFDATDYTTANAYPNWDPVGYYYQWGLKVPSQSPFQSTTAANGGGTVGPALGTAATARGGVQGTWMPNTATSTTAAGCDNIMHVGSTTNNDVTSWQYTPWSTDAYYQTVQGNPCPAGYIIPSDAQYNSIINVLPSTNLDGLLASLKFGTTNLRNNSGANVSSITTINSGTSGTVFLWTSSCRVGNTANCFYLAAGADKPIADNTLTTPAKNNGFPVRCVRVQ